MSESIVKRDSSPPADKNSLEDERASIGRALSCDTLLVVVVGGGKIRDLGRDGANAEAVHP